MAKVYQTPGVYIEELSAFPNSAVPVPTAVPAFIGYTEKAIRDKQSLHLKPTKISSYGEYLLFFGGPPKTTFELAAPSDEDKAAGLDYRLTNPKNYFTLHSHMRMFFSNGGTDCYIVSVGEYATSTEIKTTDLLLGLPPLEKEPEPTMIVIPEAIMTAIDGEATEDTVKTVINPIYPEVMAHCANMQSRFAVMDCWMDRTKYHTKDYNMKQDILWSREAIGMNNLQWGATYFPWLHTTAVSFDEISFHNFSNLGAAGDILPIKVEENGKLSDENKAALQTAYDGKYGDDQEPEYTLISLLDKVLTEDILSGDAKPKMGADTKDELKKLADLSKLNEIDKKNLHQTLIAVSPTYKSLLKEVQKELNLLPPSATMAGIYSMVDNSIGVWQSPANVSVGSVVKPAVTITGNQQDDMTLPLNGKAVNAIRTFPGKGVLVWGARTLDGNSQDWRYISVRRTVIFIEQSIKYAVEPYVFQPNVISTWANVKALITNFLTNVWQSGALAGPTPESAFSVDIGLGITMTPVDILDGYMRVVVKIAVTRPAEFIVLTFQQKMQEA